jgi:hypothetical protein
VYTVREANISNGTPHLYASLYGESVKKSHRDSL